MSKTYSFNFNFVKHQKPADKLIKKFALQDKVIKIGSHKEGNVDVDEFIVKKVPVCVDSFHMQKLVDENAKGADLKSILKRVQTTGDISLLNTRNPIYGDVTDIPATTGVAYQRAIDSANKLNSLSKDDIDLLASCKGKTPEEITLIVSNYINNKYGSKAVSKEASTTTTTTIEEK